MCDLHGDEQQQTFSSPVKKKRRLGCYSSSSSPSFSDQCLNDSTSSSSPIPTTECTMTPDKDDWQSSVDVTAHINGDSDMIAFLHSNSSCCSSPPSSVPSSRPLSLGMMYQDAVQSILQFLSHSELHHAQSVSQQWRSIIRQMKSINATILLDLASPTLTQAYRSSLSRHIQSLCLDTSSLYTHSDLCLLVASFTNLTSLIGLNLNRYRGRIQLPAGLKVLGVSFDTDRADDVIRAIGSIESLRELRIQIHVNQVRRYSGGSNSSGEEIMSTLQLSPSPIVPAAASISVGNETIMDVNFLPLCNLHCLESFRFNWNTDCNITPPSLLESIHAMTSLRELNLFLDAVGGVSLDTLRWISREKTNLTDVGHIDTLTDDGLIALTQLPQLRSLQPYHVATKELHLLRGFPNLTTLWLDATSDKHFHIAKHTLVQSIIQGCQQVTSLGVGHEEITCLDLELIFLALPMMTDLRLWNCRALGSLHCFSKDPSVRDRLLQLQIWNCRSLMLSELFHLTTCQKLKKLVLNDSFIAPLPQAVLDAFIPNSAALILPALKHFDYSYTTDGD